MNNSNEATRLVCLEAAQKLRTYVGIYTGDKQARRLIDELTNIASSAAPERSGERADEALDLAVACLHDAYSYVKDGGGDTGALDSALERIKLTRPAPAAHSSAPSRKWDEFGRTNSGDETGGTVQRFGFDCTHLPIDIIPATNGAFVYHSDYVELFKKHAALAAPSPSGESLPVQVSDAADAWPDEPTPEMQQAGASAIRFDTTIINKIWTANAVYRAMRAVIQAQAGDEGGDRG